MTKLLHAGFGSLLNVLSLSARWVAVNTNYAALPVARETGWLSLRIWE
jgi:hypothetical protein